MALLSFCKLTHIIELFHGQLKKIDCKLLKAVPRKWLVIQFSPRSYKRLDGIGDDISEIIKKNNDMLLGLGTYFLHNFDITSYNTAFLLLE